MSTIQRNSYDVSFIMAAITVITNILYSIMMCSCVVTSGAAAIRAASAAAASASTSTSATAHGGKKMDSPQPSAHKRKTEDPDQPKKKMKPGIFNPTVLIKIFFIFTQF